MANAITLGTVTLKSTFKCISVSAAFTGNDASDASCAVAFSTDGVTWRDAQPLYVDMRATIGGASNPVYLTARGSIFSLTENTSYQVRLTWTSSAGVTGTNPATNTISTITSTPPVAATVTDVTNDSEFTTARNNLNGVGGTIRLADGAYSAITFSQSGISSSWIKVIPLNAGQVTIGSGTHNTSATVSGSYIWFSGINTGQPTLRGFDVSGSHIQIQGGTIKTGNGGLSNTYYVGVYINPTSGDIRVLSNTIKTLNTTTYAGSGFAYYIFFDAANQGSHIIYNNACSGVTGGTNFVRDGMGCGGGGINDGPGENTDIYLNTVTDYDDDGLELEGRNSNVRAWGNRITGNDPTGDAQGSLLGNTGLFCGPFYFHHNFLKTSASIYSTKFGTGDYGPGFFWHNTIDNTGAANGDVLTDIAGTPYSLLMTFKNNILKGTRYTIYRGGGALPANGNQRNNIYDYNQHYTTNGAYISEWNTSVDYTTLALFKAATGQETNGQSGDPKLNSDGTLQAASPCLGKAVLIANINDPYSDWPGDDLGAFEYVAPPTTIPVRSARYAGKTVQVTFS